MDALKVIAQDSLKTGDEIPQIKIGDTVCYKVQFTGSVTDYRYIIDAKTGLIIGQNFYRTEG